MFDIKCYFFSFTLKIYLIITKLNNSILRLLKDPLITFVLTVLNKTYPNIPSGSLARVDPRLTAHESGVYTTGLFISPCT